jgi:hypothetical protein
VSFLVINEVIKRSPTKGGARLVLLVLAHHCNDDGRKCYPSLTTLSKEVALTISRLCKILDKLEAEHEIERDRSTGGWNARTQYRLIKYANSVASNTVAGNSVADNTDNSVAGASVNSVAGNRRNKYPVNLHLNPHNSRSKEPAKNADSRINPLLKSFSEKYEAKSGRPYPTTTRAKDAKCIKRLLAAEAPETITAAMDLYFADSFAAQCGFDVGRFSSSFSSLLSKSNGNGRGKFQSVAATEGKYAKFS